MQDTCRAHYEGLSFVLFFFVWEKDNIILCVDIIHNNIPEKKVLNFKMQTLHCKDNKNHIVSLFTEQFYSVKELF